ncbi:hypothetical protein RJ639_042938, partial [Escallonia herrerae]
GASSGTTYFFMHAGMFLFTKEALNVGVNTFVFVFYRQAAATVFLIPLAMFIEWLLMSLEKCSTNVIAILCKMCMLLLC